MDKVKGAIFNMIAPMIEDAVVLDLFAGSGSLGIEALSRGASRAVFVDKNRQSAQALLTALKAAGKVIIETEPQYKNADFPKETAEAIADGILKYVQYKK